MKEPGGIRALPRGLRRIYGRLRAKNGSNPDALTLLEGSADDESVKRLYHLINTNPFLPWSQRTWPGRHRELDEILAEEIRNAFPPDQAIRVHDMAASSGITSLELFERLSRDRENIHVHATDFFDALYVVSPPGSHWQTVFNRALAPVQFVSQEIALPARSWSREKTTRRVLCSWLRARELPRAFELLCAGLHGPSGTDTDGAMRHVKTISLFNPKCKALALADQRFTLGREDFLAPVSGPYHVIRLMNYRLSPMKPIRYRLNPEKRKATRQRHCRLHPREVVSAAVPESEILNLLAAIHRSLHPGGLFAIGSTEEDERKSAATLFRRSADGFITVRHLNEGSILQPKVEGFRPPAS